MCIVESYVIKQEKWSINIVWTKNELISWPTNKKQS